MITTGLKQVFLDIVSQIDSIKLVVPVTQPNPSNNKQKTISNANNVFKYYNIWDNQIDEEVKGDSYSFKGASIFIEFIPNEAKMLLNNVTTYPDAQVIFHIFSTVLDGQQDTMERNLEIYDLRDRTKRTFLGWSATGCTTFMCFSDTLDYKHKNISKYLLGFNFKYVDYVGSIFDQDISNRNGLVFKTLVNPTISSSLFKSWFSGVEYFADRSIVINGYLDDLPLVYLCKNTNTDIIFDITNWYLVNPWISGTKYEIGNKVYIIGSVYECNIENTDVNFNIANWNLISNG